MHGHYCIEFSAPFVRGKKRPRWGQGHMHADKADVEAEKALWDAYAGASLRAYGRIVTAPAKVGVKVTIRMVGVMPKSRLKRLGFIEGYTEKPDIDNAVKLILDALNPRTKTDKATGAKVVVRLGAWDDDKQIVEIDAAKVARVRGGEERTDVVVEWPHGKDGN